METNQKKTNQLDPKLKKLNTEIENWSGKIAQLKKEMSKVIVGQNNMIESLLTGLFTGGHILLEGVPGLAKTLAVKTLASVVDLNFKRIQFTPDLLPSDLVGTLIYNQQKGQFSTRKGPIFSNVILADEVNRAPSKVQSALLESMQEHQVTIGNQTYKLEEPFMVFATENPIEQEGTYPLPEAQVDRFMLKIKVEYPTPEEEAQIVQNAIVQKDEVQKQQKEIQTVINKEEIKQIRDLVNQIYVDKELIKYVVRIVNATRHPEQYKLDPDIISFGASPRASIYLALAAKAYSFMNGKPYVSPDDIRIVANSVLRHRIILSYEAEAEDKTPEEVIASIFDAVEVP